MLKRALVVVLALMVSTALFAGPGVSERLYAEMLPYSKLRSVQSISMATPTYALCPIDVTSTGTYPVSFWGGDIKPPFKMIVTQSTSSVELRYDIYTVTTAAGVTLPTATCPELILDSNNQWEKVFTGDPNIVIWAPSTVTLTVEIWSQP